MNKKFLKENNLYEAHKHFLRLCEWSYVPSTLEEEGEDEQQPQQDPNGEEMPPMDASQGPDAPQQDANGGMDGNAPQNDGMTSPQDPNGMESNPNGEEMSPMDGQDMETDPMMGDDMPPMDDETDMGEDEEVIDVEDITDAQEKMNDKVNHVGKDLGQVDDKIRSLFQAIDKMEQMIQDNNSEIASFKKEFEKRNPTATEKLNLRSLDSYPFNVNPKGYWENKGLDPNSHYSGYGDNAEKPQDEYKITNNDVDDFSEREIEQSFDIEDDLRQDLQKIFGF